MSEFRSPGIRLIALDLDGTLLRSDGTISPRVRRALRRATDSGMILVAVTARPLRHVQRLMAKTDSVALAICSNGAVGYDLAQEHLLWHDPIGKNTAQRLITALRDTLPDLRFAFELGDRCCRERGYAHPDPDREDALVDDALFGCPASVCMLSLRHPLPPVAELLHCVRSVIENAAVVSHAGGRTVDLCAPGVHKASALDRLCARLHVDRTATVAMGDMPNDVPMLRWAGRSVAVANAHPDVMQEVNDVTASNDEDGVAVVPERFTGTAGGVERRVA